jgi:hypothetical protein
LKAPQRLLHHICRGTRTRNFFESGCEFVSWTPPLRHHRPAHAERAVQLIWIGSQMSAMTALVAHAT